jgi:hypothetical protein
MNTTEDIVTSFIEVKLPDPDSFLKVRETLTRIGIASHDGKTLYQSCHILSKNEKTKYYIVHFKELFMLDGKFANFSEEDKARRNTIANLLAEWGLITLVNPDKSKSPVMPMSNIKIIPHRDKENWDLIAKYSIGGYQKKD